MLPTSKTLRALLLAAAATSLGCHAQVPSTEALSPELARRVEIMIRTRAKLPPDVLLAISPREPSDVPGFDKIEIIINENGSLSKPQPFLLSKDGKTLAQFNKYDIAADPKSIVSGAGRPARGGPEAAPVEVVVFDDLECPYCARMHTQLFPAITERYGKNVRIEYRDFPLSQHPWAMRAAIDTNCVGKETIDGYWNLVDYIHAHASDFGGSDKSLKKANDELDKLSLDEAAKDKADTATVDACIKKQDDTAIKASLKMGDGLGVEATPVLFINGERLEGAYPLVDVFRMVDGALLAAGVTPPPPYKEPAPPLVAPTPAKPGK